MSDLVEQLRELETKIPTSSDNWIEARELQLEAAARIRHLEQQLKTARKDALEEAAKWHEGQIPALEEEYKKAELNFGHSGGALEYGEIMRRAVTKITGHKSAARAIRALGEKS
jgi:predicted  nucleic acid-binding Zn-ribbon protein